jgi:hypothetical protein
MRNRKYIFDVSDLQYKPVRLPWKLKLIRATIWVAVSIGVSVIYLTAFDHYFGSPKEFKLNQDIEVLKLKYSMLDRKFENSFKTIDYLRLSDNKRYRPILNLDSLPESFLNPGYGGVDRYRDIEGYTYSNLLISSHEKLAELNNLTKVQEESFKAIEERKEEWLREMEYLPMICPIDPAISRGDGMKWRVEHPVLGIGKWHFGQDFNAPYGTEVYATGSGKVVYAGWAANGFGNYVTIDHGYGFQSIYAHLSKINVSLGLNVKRGDMLGLTGNSGTSSGPHLHYQVEKYGNHEDAINHFADDLTPEQYKEMIVSLSSKSKFR